MAGGEFEVHVNRSGRWQIQEAHGSQADAVAAARKAVGGDGVEAVKVVHEGTNRFGRHSSTVVFEQTGRSKDTGVITIEPIDAAPSQCEKANDLYGGAARQTMSKLLRNYTSKMNITVSEILYNGRELKRIMEKDNLLNSAVSRVATLQTADNKQNTNARRDALFNMVNEVLAKATAIEKKNLPSIKAVGLASLEQAIASETANPVDREYLVRVAISRDLMNERSFLGKLDSALSWADGADPANQVAALDDFIADALANPAVLRDVLGRRDNLLAAILALFDLLEGKMTLMAGAPAEAESAAISERLNRLTAAARLPGSSAVITDHLQTMMAGRNPLIREGSAAEEKAALDKLLDRMVPESQPICGTPALVMGLIERCARVLDMGGDTGRKAAITHIAGRFSNPVRKFRFLFAVHGIGSPVLTAHVDDSFKRWVAETQSAQAFSDDVNPTEVLRSATQLFYFIRESGMPAAVVQMINAHIEKLLFEYVEKSQIFRFVDNPNQPLRVRANLLMSLCLPEMLPPGRVAESARQRVVSHLRQADFLEKVVADLATQAEKERALRDLFDLMKRAGFKL